MNFIGKTGGAPGLFRAGRLAFTLLLLWNTPVCALTLEDAVDEIRSLRVERKEARTLAPMTLEFPGLTLRFEQGSLAPLEPMVVEGKPHICAVYFEGKAYLNFRAPVDVERTQIRRFFHTDSLSRELESGLLLFSDRLYDSLFRALPLAGHALKKKQGFSGETMLSDLFESGDDYLGVMLYRALCEPPERPFLVFNLKPRSKPRLFYLYDPFDRDEVVLRNHHDLPGESFMEVVCAYPEGVTSSHEDLDGVSKSRFRAIHYDIDAAISMQGAFKAKAVVTFVVRAPGGRFETLTLHPDLELESVRFADSTPVDFWGHLDPRDNPEPLYLQWEHPLAAGDTVQMVFDYKGEVSREAQGYFYVTAGAEWYPAPMDRQRATFDLRFDTPGSYQFVSTGDLVADKRSGDVLHTEWITKPARNVSFSVGLSDRLDFTQPNLPTVEVYYSAELHRELLSTPMGNAEGLEKDVASDVMSALKLFSEYFGPCPVDRLRVSEILAFHGEAFPGLLHMGIPTWVQTDSEGDQKLFRAHEVAHQWWGVDVGYDSYRDQWLSEAFAEYSALLYLQRSLGTPDMVSALARYREDIFSVRSYLFGRGERSGSIALGYRASSTRTEGDFDLVVYKKGAYVLHMLRALLLDPATLDDHKFFDLLREFYATYRGADATTADFQKLAEKYAGEKLDWFFRQWVYGEELPECKLSSKSTPKEDGTWSVTGDVVTTGVTDPFRIDMLLEVDFAGVKPVYVRRKIGPGQCPIEIDHLAAPPTKVLLNPFGAVLARTK